MILRAVFIGDRVFGGNFYLEKDGKKSFKHNKTNRLDEELIKIIQDQTESKLPYGIDIAAHKLKPTLCMFKNENEGSQLIDHLTRNPTAPENQMHEDISAMFDHSNNQNARHQIHKLKYPQSGNLSGSGSGANPNSQAKFNRKSPTTGGYNPSSSAFFNNGKTNTIGQELSDRSEVMVTNLADLGIGGGTGTVKPFVKGEILNKKSSMPEIHQARTNIKNSFSGKKDKKHMSNLTGNAATKVGNTPSFFNRKLNVFKSQGEDFDSNQPEEEKYQEDQGELGSANEMEQVLMDRTIQNEQQMISEHLSMQKRHFENTSQMQASKSKSVYNKSELASISPIMQNRVKADQNYNIESVRRMRKSTMLRRKSLTHLNSFRKRENSDFEGNTPVKTKNGIGLKYGGDMSEDRSQDVSRSIYRRNDSLKQAQSYNP
jgi:hypothetical protein